MDREPGAQKKAAAAGAAAKPPRRRLFRQVVSKAQELKENALFYSRDEVTPLPLPLHSNGINGQNPPQRERGRGVAMQHATSALVS